MFPVVRIPSFAGAALAVPLIAFQSPAQAESPPAQFQPIVVTASRTEQSLDATLASTTVIDREEIERRQAQSVPDALRGVPGLSLANNGGMGKLTSVFLRGTEPDHVLVLIDGVRAGSATAGAAAFQDVPIDQVERIEVVRGPRASLYGSEAVGGVIQIFTRKGGDGLKPWLSVGAGSHALYKTAGGVSGGDGRAWYSLSGARQETRGYNACDPRAATLFGGCYTNEPDHDGYRNTSGSARAGYRFANGVEVEGNLLQAEGMNAYDGTFQNRSAFVQQMLGGRLSWAVTDVWKTSLRAGRTLDELDNFKNRAFSSTFNTQRVSTTWQNDFAVAPGHLLSAGLDYYSDQVDGTTNYAVDARSNKAGFVQHQWTWGRFDAQLGTRYDDNEQFGSHATGNVALGYLLDGGVRVTGSWGNTFKAPTFNELYYPGFGNPRLRPEQAESVELGLAGNHLGVRWGVNGYHTWVDQLIGFDASFSPVNIDRAGIRGLEASATTRLGGFDLAATGSVIDSENLGQGPNHGNVLARRPEAQFRFDIDRRIGRVRLGASVHGEERRFDDLANRHRLPGFVTLDLRAAVPIVKDVTLEARLANLLNEQYSTARFYPQDDRNFLITVKYQPTF